MKADKCRRCNDPFRPSANPSPPDCRFVRCACACGDNPDDESLMPPAAVIKTDKAV
ncbi:hypothetical protein [Neisseria elongata]|uniref:hypothetical protein n=1 Tax=Neisseria elongata TaxID=495 RepID=UPI001364D0ED|nr:hypothetical protein [Neisseria elongata]